MQTFLLHTIDGRIQNPELLRKAIALLPDGHHTLTIKDSRKRSNAQNAYFHGVLLPLVFQGLRDAGFDEVEDHEDAKLVIKAKFLRKKIMPDRETGEALELIQDTHRLSVQEFSELIDRVIKWGAEYLGIRIPYPNEYFSNF